MRCILSVSLICLSAVAAFADTIHYPFSTPTDDLNGWKVIAGEADFEAGGLGAGKSHDSPHKSLLVRSPMFRLDENGKISVKLQGGTGGKIPTSALALPEKSVDRGAMGIALRRVSDDAWLINAHLGKNGSDQTIEFSKKGLSELYNAAPDEVYTLDFFDAGHGGWGHAELLDVSLNATIVEALPKAPAGFETARPLFLGVLHGKLAFDKKELYATPGSKVSLTLFNSDEMAHNWVICKPDPKVADEIGMYVMENLAEMTEADYIPKDPRILFHSTLVAPGNSDTEFITMPTEKGAYPFVCTFPGHHILMRGVLHVVDKLPLPKPDQITELQPADPYTLTLQDRPVIVRGPLNGGANGSAVICVAMPDGTCFSFDTYTCVISNVWKSDPNGFINAKAAWGGRGGKALDIRGQVKHTNSKERKPGEVRFKSYVIQEDGIPVFEFSEGDKVIQVSVKVDDRTFLATHTSDGETILEEKIELSK